MERQTTIYDLIGETATKRKGIIKERVITEEVKTSDLAERPLFGVLMSAHWCPPCKGFLPHLKKFCDEVNALDIHKRDDRVKGFRLKGQDGEEMTDEEIEDPVEKIKQARNFDLLYVSMDNSKDQYREHLIDIGNWMSIPFGDPRIQAIKEKYEVVGIPQLIIFDSRTGLPIKRGDGEDFKPQVKSGWGVGGGGNAQPSSLGMQKKTAAAQYWDNKTTELVIPEMEAEAVADDMYSQVAEPPKLEQNMANLRELEKDLALNVPSITPDGVDISLLTSVIRPIADLIETDMQWDYLSLQAEIGQNYREKYGDENQLIEQEGTRANNI